jgi:hypothetical protein
MRKLWWLSLALSVAACYDTGPSRGRPIIYAPASSSPPPPRAIYVEPARPEPVYAPPPGQIRREEVHERNELRKAEHEEEKAERKEEKAEVKQEKAERKEEKAERKEDKAERKLDKAKGKGKGKGKPDKDD